MPTMTLLVDLDNFFIRDQRGGRRIVARKVPSENQWRTKNAPQRHDCLLLVGSELGRRSASFYTRHAQLAEREHIRIGPSVALSNERCPVARVIELLPEKLPVIPEIVGDAPHLRVLLKEFSFRKRCRPRRNAEHHWTSSFVHRLTERLHLRRLIQVTSHVVGLDEVHAPRRVELCDRV